MHDDAFLMAVELGHVFQINPGEVGPDRKIMCGDIDVSEQYWNHPVIVSREGRPGEKPVPVKLMQALR